MRSSTTYTIAPLEESTLDEETVRFIVEIMRDLEKGPYGEVFDPFNFSIARYFAIGGHVFLARRDGKPVGVLLTRLLTSVFDSNLRILHQDLLYSRSPRVTKLLMEFLIDFGRRNANHVISMIGAGTNIKPRSLERLGFSQFETLFRLRV